MMMKDTMVLYPSLGRGHLVSMVELGKLILTHHPCFSITILILTPPNTNSDNYNNAPATTFPCPTTAKYFAAVSAAVPSISFHYIPSTSLPSDLPPHTLTLELVHLSNHHVQQTLQTISQTSNLRGIVLDMFNYEATRVSASFNIPTYFYYSSGASSLAMLLQFPTIHQSTTKSIKDLNLMLRIPGLPRIYTADLPDSVMDRESSIYQIFLDIAISMRDCHGIIINTFEAIETRAIKALKDGLCLPEGPTPPVFCIGPVISAPCVEKDDNGCLTWLDSQPSQSVVFLSFGSLGRFSRAQIKEMAIGLEKSQQRFLWLVRSKLSEENDSEPSLEELLPEGFLERTKGRGLLVRNWAPQVAVLRHASVGGFVTHCGWNSTLEAVCAGVPMLTWPLYAEQKFNRVILVQEMKVALALNESKEGFVSATELADRVKELMESDRGKDIRQRVFKMKVSAVEATADFGSSRVALNRLAELWKQS